MLESCHNRWLGEKEKEVYSLFRDLLKQGDPKHFTGGQKSPVIKENLSAT